ncbi:hypothetical protein V0288_06160 [Pannus brasiliensis CCIBt3594]|uniref:Uncharacterized protein n=1 Tax=Pannus brasiliensis CCIBt3594 TaxID=1427578 RepID=A0AAW9QNK7_9CHRO
MENFHMIRRFIASIALALVIILSVAISPVLAEQQYSQSQQVPEQTEQKSTQKPYTQTQQMPPQTEQRASQKPYTQSQQSYEGQKQYSQTQQKPGSESED